MPRPRAFDEEAALDAASARFWTQGYAATSVRDLGDAMGMGAASLYNAFGDKRALFARCLDRYLDRGLRARVARLEEALPPRRAIEAFLAEILALSRSDRRGCLMVNSAIEAGASQEPDIGALLEDGLVELEAFFRRCVLAGQRDGSIAPARDPADLGALLLATVMGLRVLARARPEPALLEGAVRSALALLDDPHPSSHQGEPPCPTP